MKGKLVVIEGTDGSGKATQIKLLAEKLSAKSSLTRPASPAFGEASPAKPASTLGGRGERPLACVTIDFPRYEDNMYGRMVAKYLRGEFGSVYDLDPYLITLMYAGDRFLARPLLEKWLQDGKIVLANRYVSSNKANTAARLTKKEREPFYKWNDRLEYETNGMPKEDIVIVLYVPPKVGMKNVDSKGHRNYLGRHGKDMHEADVKYQRGAAKAYLELAKQEPHWVVVECTKKGAMRSKEDIHNEILEILQKKGLVRK